MKKVSDICVIPVLSMFEIVIDTREQHPWMFENITVKRNKQDKMLVVGTVRGKLKTGDYSIKGYENQLAVERKSPEDLINTVAHSRDRFIRELERLNEMEWGCVLVEEEWKATMVYCSQHTGFSPVSLDSSILAWMQRYKNVHWVFRPGRFAAAKTCWKICDRFWRDHNE